MARIKSISKGQKRKWIWREKTGKGVILFQMTLINVNTSKPLEQVTIKTDNKS